MAYFSGAVTAKPWSKVDGRFISLFLLSFSGIVASVIVAHNILRPSSAGATQTGAAVPAILPSKLSLTLVATKEIPSGTKLLPSMFKLEAREVGDSGQGTITNLDEIVGRSTRVDIALDTPVVRSALTTAGDSPDIGERIPSGYRAVAIPVNALTGVEGWVRPGAHVDVVWSTERDKQFVVVTIVENAKVLSVEQSLESERPATLPSATTPNHITLVVPSVDAQKIQLAKSSGSLSLSLRGVTDTNGAGSNLLTSDNLLLRRDIRDEIKGKVKIDGVEYGFVRGELMPMARLEGSQVGE
jgi:pilus assembly protein CpaB